MRPTRIITELGTSPTDVHRPPPTHYSNPSLLVVIVHAVSAASHRRPIAVDLLRHVTCDIIAGCPAMQPLVRDWSENVISVSSYRVAGYSGRTTLQVYKSPRVDKSPPFAVDVKSTNHRAAGVGDKRENDHRQVRACLTNTCRMPPPPVLGLIPSLITYSRRDELLYSKSHQSAGLSGCWYTRQLL